MSNTVFGQVNVSLLGQKTYTTDVSDIWGYADGAGNEYALVGLFNGTSIVDVSNPASPVELFFFSGPNSIWRDIKVWNQHAYVINENSGGVLIIDLSDLPLSADTVGFTGGSALNIESAHNIFIDENGVAYVAGTNAVSSGGVLFLDLTADPMLPTYLGEYDQRYVHDLFVRGDTMWTGEISDGIFSVVDVSDKSAPLILATQGTSSDFTHNCWLSDDGAYLFTTDEVSGAFVDAYDVSDLSDIQLLDKYQSNPGSGVIPHNTFVKGDFLVTSYYRDGITIVDASNPASMIETGFYDTSPLSGNGFDGAWGVYPYLPSGNILVSDIDNGLFILGPTYTYGCYLTGVVSDSVSGSPINGAEISLIGAPLAAATSGISGDYFTGLADAGLYDLSVSKAGYESKVLNGISLANGATAIADVELKPLSAISVSGVVIDSLSGLPIPFAEVLITNGSSDFSQTTDALGQFNFPSVFEGSYDIIYGEWGYRTKGKSAVSFVGGPATITLETNRGWYDDFIFNNNWSASGTASTGWWERAEPEGTELGTDLSNPDFDVAGDFGDLAYVTGNDGGGAGSDDIDDGEVVLTSPAFNLSAYGDPHIQLSRWFYNAGGSGAANDSLVIAISDGTSTVEMDVISNGDFESSWRPEDYRVADFMDPVDGMKLILTASDRASSGHIVEAGLDRFTVVDEAVTAAPVPAIGLPDGPVCEGTAVTFEDLSTQFPNAWYWTFPGADPLFSVKQNPTVVYHYPGSYDVTLHVLNAEGSAELTLTAAIEVVPAVELNASSTAASSVGGDGSATVSIGGGTPPFTIQWNDPYNQTTETATDLNGGTYSVTVTDANGCSSVIEVVVDGGVNGLEGIESVASVQLSSNPFSDVLSVNYSLLSPNTTLRFALYDTEGRLVELLNSEDASGTMALGKNIPAGLYLLDVSSSNGKHAAVSVVKM